MPSADKRITTNRSALKEEQRSRTITFGRFPEDTKSEQIKSLISQWLEDTKDDIEEVFAFGKFRAEAGGARFKTEDAMWQYMAKLTDQRTHEFMGRQIYTNADGAKKTTDSLREKAVRKVVRAIIEKEGGDGKKVKEHIETDYKKGYVWYKGPRVATWNAETSRMKLLGEAVILQAAFDKLMGNE